MTDQLGNIDGHDQPATDDAAVAFDALRNSVGELARYMQAHIVVIREALMSIGERVEEGPSRKEHFEHLGGILDELILIRESQQSLEALPILRYRLEDYRRMSETIVDRAVAEISRATLGRLQDFDDVALHIRRLVTEKRERDLQDRWLLIAGGGGVLLGIMLTLAAGRLAAVFGIYF